MDERSRRTFLHDMLIGLMGIGLAGWETTARAAPATATRWLDRMQDLTVALTEGRVTSSGWRRRAQRLTRPVPLAELLRLVDFRTNATLAEADDDAEPQRQLALPLPSFLDRFAFTAILAYVRRGTAVVPHGHHNMVSMHLVLQGAVHLRQYDRVRDEPAHVLIRPRADRICHPGDTSAVAAARGNVHWFRGVSDAFALIVAAYDLDPAAGPTGRDYVDPLVGESLPDGSLRVPRLTAEEAHRRYASA